MAPPQQITSILQLAPYWRYFSPEVYSRLVLGYAATTTYNRLVQGYATDTVYNKLVGWYCTTNVYNRLQFYTVDANFNRIQQYLNTNFFNRLNFYVQDANYNKIRFYLSDATYGKLRFYTTDANFNKLQNYTSANWYTRVQRLVSDTGFTALWNVYVTNRTKFVDLISAYDSIMVAGRGLPRTIVQPGAPTQPIRSGARIPLGGGLMMSVPQWTTSPPFINALRNWILSIVPQFQLPQWIIDIQPWATQVDGTRLLNVLSNGWYNKLTNYVSTDWYNKLNSYTSATWYTKLGNLVTNWDNLPTLRTISTGFRDIGRNFTHISNYFDQIYTFGTGFKSVFDGAGTIIHRIRDAIGQVRTWSTVLHRKVRDIQTFITNLTTRIRSLTTQLTNFRRLMEQQEYRLGVNQLYDFRIDLWISNIRFHFPPTREIRESGLIAYLRALFDAIKHYANDVRRGRSQSLGDVMLILGLGLANALKQFAENVFNMVKQAVETVKTTLTELKDGFAVPTSDGFSQSPLVPRPGEIGTVSSAPTLPTRPTLFTMPTIPTKLM